MLALYIGKILDKISDKELDLIINGIQKISENIQRILDDKENIFSIAKKYYEYEKAFFIGRNLDYAVCMEGSLKLKEISYICSEAYAAGELKHGTISLVDDNTLVVAVATQKVLFDKIISNIREVKSRGAKVLTITTNDYSDKFSKVSDDIIIIPGITSELMPSLSVIPLQLFSYYIANLRGCDIDKPKNLAKSVTVE